MHDDSIWSTTKNVSNVVLMIHAIQGKRWHTQLYVAGEVLLSDRKPPEIYVGKLGRFTSEGGFVHEQIPSRVSVHVVAAGRGTMQVGRRSYAVGAGDVFVFFPHQPVRYFDDPNHPWVYTWFQLCGQRGVAAMQESGISPAQPYREGGQSREIMDAIRFTEDALSREVVSPLAAAGGALRLIDALAVNRNNVSLSIAEQARALCDQGDGFSLNVEELAAALQVSRTTLFREFQRAYGQSPKQVLDVLRLDHAKELLAHTTARIKQVSRACGYQSEAYFSRVFRARFGAPPGAWRARLQTISR